MKYSTRIKPITELQSHATEIMRDLAETREPLVLTEGGEARAVLQDVRSYEETQESLALLKILALGLRQVEEGRVHRAEDVISELRRGKRG